MVEGVFRLRYERLRFAVLRQVHEPPLKTIHVLESVQMNDREDVVVETVRLETAGTGDRRDPLESTLSPFFCRCVVSTL